ncbi:hypothetical protein WAF17_19475 [Bernardetia sp. ABR2-2B]|uniref:hypothetical protein n=1 Tax=Bernardetia sp. ABR2-2B TaxID=3127472 RepID=UPI0030CB0E7A
MSFKLKNELDYRLNTIQSTLLDLTLISTFNNLFSLSITSLKTTLQNKLSAFYSFQGTEQTDEQNNPKDEVELIPSTQLLDSSDDSLFLRSYKIYI